MRISDWSSDVCSSDLHEPPELGEKHRKADEGGGEERHLHVGEEHLGERGEDQAPLMLGDAVLQHHVGQRLGQIREDRLREVEADAENHKQRSEEHTSELQSLMRISTAVFCLKKKKHN